MHKTPLHRSLAALGLALLLAVWTACKPAADQEKAGATNADPAPGQTSTAAGAPAGDGLQPAAPASDAPMDAKDLPGIVAKVNGQEIKKEILLQGAQVVQLQMAQRGSPVTPSTRFYRDVLNELIAITLLQQDAKAQGMTASPQEVQRQIDARKKAFPNEAAFKVALAQAGITEEVLRKQASDQLAVQKYVQTKLTANVAVSEEEARSFYEQNKGQLHPPERRHLRHILVQVDGKAAPPVKEQARQKAEGLFSRLQAGEDFAKLARENSDDAGSKPGGGDLGWIIKGQTVPPFDKAAFALTKPNELSPVVESPFGFHIIQLLERQQSETVPYEQVKDRIAAMLKQQQTQKQVEARVRELRAKGKVEVFI